MMLPESFAKLGNCSADLGYAARVSQPSLGLYARQQIR